MITREAEEEKGEEEAEVGEDEEDGEEEAAKEEEEEGAEEEEVGGMRGINVRDGENYRRNNNTTIEPSVVAFCRRFLPPPAFCRRRCACAQQS